MTPLGAPSSRSAARSIAGRQRTEQQKQVRCFCASSLCKVPYSSFSRFARTCPEGQTYPTAPRCGRIAEDVLPSSDRREVLAYVGQDAGKELLEREDAAEGEVDATHRDGDDGTDLEQAVVAEAGVTTDDDPCVRPAGEDLGDDPLELLDGLLAGRHVGRVQGGAEQKLAAEGVQGQVAVTVRGN